jgi:hypothetical protein
MSFVEAAPFPPRGVELLAELLFLASFLFSFPLL